MDYWRVKSIDNCLRKFEITGEYKVKAQEILCKKAKILLEVYKKHNNVVNFIEVETIMNHYIS